ncbi:MAG: hypothetical protein IH859_07310, partial [Chloroflexi bacterium]|nr:hypothetical protein [Chloroflexota bacterium]
MTASLLGRLALFPENVLWVGATVPMIITAVQIFFAYKFRLSPFAWLAALTFSISFGQSLTWLAVPPAFHATAWAILAFVFLAIERRIAIFAPKKQASWLANFRWPLGMGVISFAVISLALTLPNTLTALNNIGSVDISPLLLTQSLVVLLVIVAARAYRSRWPLFLEPWLAFIPLTLFFTNYRIDINGEQLSSLEIGVVWAGLGAVHFVAGALLDKASARYSHGLFLGGYALIVLAVIWTLPQTAYLVWTMGVGILASVASALLVHFKRHHSWEELTILIFSNVNSSYRAYFQSIFLWITAWAFPVWSLVLLVDINVTEGMQWIGFGGTGLVFLGIIIWLRRYDRIYTWPFITSSQFYIALGLLISAPITLTGLTEGFESLQMQQTAGAFILFQAVAVIYYGASAWMLRTAFFAHVSSWLSFFPITLVGILFGKALLGQELTISQFALLWVGWATVAILIGWGLDNLKIHYARGLYLFGYVLGLFALIWSTSYRLTNVIVLGLLLLIWTGSQILVHYGRHRVLEDFVNTVIRDHKSNIYRVLKSGFLYLAVIGFPFWLSQILVLNGLSNSWLGVAFSATAPIYIALGLILSKAKKEYSWPLYVVGYILTAVGTMMVIEDQLLTIYVLTLNVVVYAFSTYIFRQVHWLYISSTIILIVALLTIDYNLDSLPADWVSGIFMGIAFIYFGVAQIFDRKSTSSQRGISEYAAPFYFPSYLVSAIAIAVASAGDQINLAIVVYLLGIAYYALSAWAFRESVFLYPATWLAAVPYYLLLTQTDIDASWYGIAWLPLILAYIGIGKIFFHKTAIGIKGIKTFFASLDQPAMPFYLLAYGLSLSMLVLSRNDPIPLTWSLFAAAMIYIGSSLMFKVPIWLYPGLLAAHLGVIAYFAIEPLNIPRYYIALP